MKSTGREALAPKNTADSARSATSTTMRLLTVFSLQKHAHHRGRLEDGRHNDSFLMCHVATKKIYRSKTASFL